MPQIAGHDGEVEYADHEVQTIGVQSLNKGTSELEELVQAEPVSERGIDNDELAELVAMRRIGTVQFQGAQAGESPVLAEAGFGLNLTGDQENPTQLPTSNLLVETAESPEARTVLGELDDPGVLDTFHYGAVPPQSGGTALERFVDLRETFGSGPYVDATDDLSFYLETEAASPDGDEFKLELVYQLYWNVEEMPEGRASFSRP